MIPSDLVWGAIGLLLTVMIFSYLIGDNLFFRLAAYLFVGVTAGFLAQLILKQIVWPYMLQPLLFGSWIERLWMLIPLGLAILLVISQFTRFNGLGRIPLAFLAGLAAAIIIGGSVFGTLIPQLKAVSGGFEPNLWKQDGSGQPWMKILEASVMLIGVICTLSYFHFGRTQINNNSGSVSGSGVISTLASVGEVFIGLALGTVFAGLFSSALAALIDRLLFIGGFIVRLRGGG